MKGKVSMNRSRTTERTFIYSSMRMKSREKEVKETVSEELDANSLSSRKNTLYDKNGKEEGSRGDERCRKREQKQQGRHIVSSCEGRVRETQILSKDPLTLVFQPIVSFVFRASCPESSYLSLEADTERDNKIL